MLARLRIEEPALLLVWASVPAVTLLAVLPDVEEKSAPEPTARAPAMAAVASGTRTFLLARTLILGAPGVWAGRGPEAVGIGVDPDDEKPTEGRTTRFPHEIHTK